MSREPKIRWNVPLSRVEPRRRRSTSTRDDPRHPARGTVARSRRSPQAAADLERRLIEDAVRESTETWHAAFAPPRHHGETLDYKIASMASTHSRAAGQHDIRARRGRTGRISTVLRPSGASSAGAGGVFTYCSRAGEDAPDGTKDRSDPSGPAPPARISRCCPGSRVRRGRTFRSCSAGCARSCPSARDARARLPSSLPAPRSIIRRSRFSTACGERQVSCARPGRAPRRASGRWHSSTTAPLHETTARSIAFSSSRTLPGQVCAPASSAQR